MKALTLLQYINFGSNLEYLRMVKVGNGIHGEGRILENINTLLDIVDKSDFIVTKNGIIILKIFREKLERTPDTHKLTSGEAGELFKIMEKLTFVVSAESKTKYAFFITEKRIDTKKLLFNMESLFAHDVFNVLTDSIQYDIKESGKCIAFECPTASAFHILRGLEGLLRVLANKLSPLVDTSHMNWGPLISHLKSLNISEISILLDSLDRIRDNYRNPTNHPEKIFNIEETQDLFNMCVGVVNDIVGYMKDNSHV